MQTYFAQAGVQKALKSKLHISTPKHLHDHLLALDNLARTPGQQPLHMDFVRGNILFTPTTSQVSGILDFEKVAWGHPTFDVARTLAFLLVDCKYKTEPKIRKYFLHSGYNKRGKATFTGGANLEKLIDMFLTYDFYKFLLHNPYESLPDNEHFVRTQALLHERNIVDQV
jgi:Ser/Thr protein kinase RdoA (MazF antagonist)